MDVEKLDHVLRAAGDVTGHKRFVLIGSTAIFAWRTIVPPDMAMTREVDLYAQDLDATASERIADDLDATLGQASPFDSTHGYYCDGVGPETAILPQGWRGRAKVYASPGTNGVSALAPHPADIGVAKLCAGREKDMDWLASAFQNAIIDPLQVEALIEAVPIERFPAGLDLLRNRLAGLSWSGDSATS